MFFNFIFLFQLLFYVQCEIWTKYKYSSNHDQELDSHLTRCGRKADDNIYCAARIHRVTLTCEPLHVEWCVTRIEEPGWFYMEKATVNETVVLVPTRDNKYRYMSTSIPVLMEPGTEVAMGFTPEPIWPKVAVHAFPQIRSEDYAWKLSIEPGTGEIHRELRFNNTWSTQLPNIRYPHTLHQVSVLTIRCTDNGLEVIVDGELLCKVYDKSFRHTTRLLRINVYDNTSTLHFVSYTAAVH